jgi:hypothetical protein
MTGSPPTSMSAEAPVLDHVVVNARDRIDAAADCYRRLGFDLSPQGRHTLGSLNHLAVFGGDYLELAGIDPAAANPRGDLLRFAAGLNGLVFACADAAALYDRLAATGAPVAPPVEFARPVALATGSEDARFRVVRVEADAAPYGRVYFCQHLTPALVWREEWQAHPNGAIAVARVVLAAAEPDAAATLYRGLFGADCLRPIAGGLRLVLGAAGLDIVTPAALADQFGDAAPAAEGREIFMAALAVRTRDLGRARAVLGPLARGEEGRLVVAAADAWGLALEFVA